VNCHNIRNVHAIVRTLCPEVIAEKEYVDYSRKYNSAFVETVSIGRLF